VLTVELRELDEGPISDRILRVVQRAVCEHRRLGFNYRAAAQEDRQPRMTPLVLRVAQHFAHRVSPGRSTWQRLVSQTGTVRQCGRNAR
jgi:hypothetical protein